jgi:hypothetical protein
VNTVNGIPHAQSARQTPGSEAKKITVLWRNVIERSLPQLNQSRPPTVTASGFRVCLLQFLLLRKHLRTLKALPDMPS